MEGSTFTGMEEIVEGFNNYFTDVGEKLQKTIKETNLTIFDFMGVKRDYKFEFKLITQEQLLKIIRNLKPKTSVGQDYLNNKIIKACFPGIISVILHLVNLSLESGIFPPPLKTSRILPIHKDGPKTDFGNFRPISLISSFGKLVEKIVAKQITKYLEDNGLIFKHQYGFRGKHDCQQPLLYFTEKIRPTLDSKNKLFGIATFIDMRKAFDTIPFTQLIQKLEFYGVSGNTLKWFEDYLFNREQCVEIEGHR